MPRILNVAKFWMWQGSQFASVTHSEYDRICLDRALKISWVLNMPGFWIWQGSEYARVTQVSKYATIRPNVWIYNNRQGSEYVSYYT